MQFPRNIHGSDPIYGLGNVEKRSITLDVFTFVTWVLINLMLVPSFYLCHHIRYFVFRTTPFGMYSKGTEDDAEDKGIAQKKCLFSFNCRACERACNLLFVPFYFV